MAVKDYSTNPDENITISGINIGEGCAAFSASLRNKKGPGPCRGFRFTSCQVLFGLFERPIFHKG